MPPDSVPQLPLPQPYQPYNQFPFPNYRDRGGTPIKLLTDLIKIYSNNNKKYGGEEYNILDAKL